MPEWSAPIERDIFLENTPKEANRGGTSFFPFSHAAPSFFKILDFESFFKRLRPLRKEVRYPTLTILLLLHPSSTFPRAPPTNKPRPAIQSQTQTLFYFEFQFYGGLQLSRQKSWPHGKKKKKLDTKRKTHGKKKNLTGKTERLAAKRITSTSLQNK